MYPDSGLPRVIISGGLSRSEFLRSGLASCLRQNILWPDQSEATLLNAARLANGSVDWPVPSSEIIEPVAEAAYLREKCQRWLDWVCS